VPTKKTSAAPSPAAPPATEISGSFDGHVSNASAYDDQALRGVIYKSIAE
jgi:hypothetical protein